MTFPDEGTPTDDAAETAISQIGADIEDTTAEPAAEAPSPPATPTEATPPESTPDQPRDERGRFAEKDSTPAPEPSPEAAAPAEAPPEPTATPPEETYEPATYRADGADFEIPGSAVGEDGTFIPAEIWHQQVLPLLAAGQAARGGSLQRTLQERAREVQHWQAQAQAAHAQSQAIIAKIDQMVESGTMGEWLEGVQQNWPVLKAQAEANMIRQQAQLQAQQLQQFQSEHQLQALEPQFSAALEQSLVQFGTQAGLTDDQLGRLYEYLNSPAMRQSWRVRAQQDDPMTGLRAGEWAINNDVIQQAVQWAAQVGTPSPAPTKPATPTPSVPPKVAKAEAANAKKAASPPPVVSGKGGSAPSGKPRAPQYKDGYEAVADIFDNEKFLEYEVEE